MPCDLVKAMVTVSGLRHDRRRRVARFSSGGRVPRGRAESFRSKRTTTLRLTRKLAFAATAAAALCLGTVIPAAADSTPDADDIPTFQEFEASTYRDIDGAYVVNGDEVISNQGELRSFYEQLLGADPLTN